jgi:hypothetical protein
VNEQEARALSANVVSVDVKSETNTQFLEVKLTDRPSPMRVLIVRSAKDVTIRAWYGDKREDEQEPFVDARLDTLEMLVALAKTRA